jgi:predicted metal-dependent enzyme (double-stranded beta helix superfamily)
MPYGIGEMIVDLKAARSSAADEAAMLVAAQTIVGKAVEDGSWFDPAYRTFDADTRYGDVLLHEEDDHSLAVFAISWAPGVTTPPHDHHTWVVIACAEGEETNHLWRPTTNGTGFECERTVRVVPGTPLGLGSPDIHTVGNDTDAVAVSIHVYGMHPDHTTRSQYDPVSGEAQRYLSTD